MAGSAGWLAVCLHLRHILANLADLATFSYYVIYCKCCLALYTYFLGPPGMIIDFEHSFLTIDHERYCAAVFPWLIIEQQQPQQKRTKCRKENKGHDVPIELSCQPEGLL